MIIEILKIENIKNGDEFWECESGYNVHYVAICDSYSVDMHKIVIAKDDNNDVHTFLAHSHHQQYAPKLYTQPQYVSGKEYM